LRRRAIVRLVVDAVLAGIGLPAATLGVLMGVSAMTAGEPLGGCVAFGLTLFGGFLLTAGVLGVRGAVAELRRTAPRHAADHFDEPVS
jgi:hypothetical protein